MAKFFVTYARSQYFQVEVEAADEAEAEDKANEVIHNAILDDLYFANDKVELSSIELAENQ